MIKGSPAWRQEDELNDLPPFGVQAFQTPGEQGRASPACEPTEPWVSLIVRHPVCAAPHLAPHFHPAQQPDLEQTPPAA